MVISLFKGFNSKVKVRSCRAADPATCRYHSLHVSLTAALKANDVNAYLKLKTAIAEADKEAQLKGFYDESSIVVATKEKAKGTTKAVAPVPDLTVNTETKREIHDFATDEDGQLTILSEDKVALDRGYQSVYRFGEFTDMETAKQLHQDDLLKTLQNGDCADLAHELYNNNPHVVNIAEVFLQENGDRNYEKDGSIHVIAQLKDGRLVDSLGVWSKESLETYWRTIEPTAYVKDDFPLMEEDKDPSKEVHPINATLGKLTDKLYG